MHNESVSDRESNATETETETIKPSKLTRVKSAAVTAAWIIIPTAATAGLTYVGYKTTKMQLDTAKLTYETAKIQNLASTVTPKS